MKEVFARAGKRQDAVIWGVEGQCRVHLVNPFCFEVFFQRFIEEIVSTNGAPVDFAVFPILGSQLLVAFHGLISNNLHARQQRFGTLWIVVCAVESRSPVGYPFRRSLKTSVEVRYNTPLLRSISDKQYSINHATLKAHSSFEKDAQGFADRTTSTRSEETRHKHFIKCSRWEGDSRGHF